METVSTSEQLSAHTRSLWRIAVVLAVRRVEELEGGLVRPYQLLSVTLRQVRVLFCELQAVDSLLFCQFWCPLQLQWPHGQIFAQIAVDHHMGGLVHDLGEASSQFSSRLVTFVCRHLHNSLCYQVKVALAAVAGPGLQAMLRLVTL